MVFRLSYQTPKSHRSPLGWIWWGEQEGGQEERGSRGDSDMEGLADASNTPPLCVRSVILLRLAPLSPSKIQIYWAGAGGSGGGAGTTGAVACEDSEVFLDDRTAGGAEY